MGVYRGVLCLQVWRGTVARMRYRRMRAALVILRAYRAYKVKSYIREVNRRFKNVRSMKDYGRQVKWPTPPKVLRKFEEALRSIYSRYSTDQLYQVLFHRLDLPSFKESHFQHPWTCWQEESHIPPVLFFLSG